MKNLILAIVLMAIPATLFAQANKVPVAKDNVYGAKITSTATPVALNTLVQKKRFGKTSLVKATVTDVCSKKGCWMVLKDGKTEARVTFKDYGFFVPSALIDQKVIIQGVLNVKTISEADRRHYAEDAGASKEEIEKINGDAKEYIFEATGVKAL